MTIDKLIEEVKEEETKKVEDEVTVAIPLSEYVFNETIKRDFNRLIKLIDNHKHLSFSKDQLDIDGLYFCRDFRVLFPEIYEEMLRIERKKEDGTLSGDEPFS